MNVHAVTSGLCTYRLKAVPGMDTYTALPPWSGTKKVAGHYVQKHQKRAATNLSTYNCPDAVVYYFFSSFQLEIF